jgi:hypothetical protein
LDSSSTHTSTPGAGSLREQMPTTAWFIDFVRQTFGEELANEQVKKGLWLQKNVDRVRAEQGEAAAVQFAKDHAHMDTFFAEENGITLGVDTCAL